MPERLTSYEKWLVGEFEHNWAPHRKINRSVHWGDPLSEVAKQCIREIGKRVNLRIEFSIENDRQRIDVWPAKAP